MFLVLSAVKELFYYFFNNFRGPTHFFHITYFSPLLLLTPQRITSIKYMPRAYQNLIRRLRGQPIFQKIFAKFSSQKTGTYHLTASKKTAVIPSLIERQTACYRASLRVMDTSQGESSKSMHSLNQVSVFSILEMKVVFSKFRGYCMEFCIDLRAIIRKRTEGK